MKYRAYSEYKDSCVEWLGEIPARWTLEKFKYLFQVSNEKNGVEPVGQMLSVSGYRGVEVKEYNDEAKKRTLEEVAEYRVVRKGQLVVNTMWLNYSGLGVSDYEGYVSPVHIGHIGLQKMLIRNIYIICCVQIHTSWLILRKCKV